MFKLEKHPNGYASVVGHGLQSQDARTLTHEEGQRLVDTINEMESERPQLRDRVDTLKRDLHAQDEARCEALKEVKDLKALNETAEERIQALKSLATRDRDAIERLLDAIEASQRVLEAYISPSLPDTAETAQKALSDLLGILDDGKLVTLCRGLRNIPRFDLPNCLSRWHENADAQITFDYKHWTNVSIEGEYFVALSDGKTAWMRAGFPKDRVVYSPNCPPSEPRIPITFVGSPPLGPKTRRSLVKVIGILERNHMLKDAKRLKKLLR